MKHKGNPWHDSRGRFCHGPGETDSSGNRLTDEQRNEAVMMSSGEVSTDMKNCDFGEKKEVFDHYVSEKQIQKNWEDFCDRQKNQMFEQGDEYTAECLVTQKLISQEDAENLLKNGEVRQYTEELFDVVKECGSYEPSKPAMKNMSHRDLEARADYEFNGDFHKAGVEIIKGVTGYSDEEAEKALTQMDVWFGYKDGESDTETLDKYIDNDHSYDGAIYRGLTFSDAVDEESEMYESIADLKPGDSFTQNGHNASWSASLGVAMRFATVDDKKVLIRCINNRTAAPVAVYSTYEEDEVLSRSDSEWVVLGNVMYGEVRILNVIERRK